MLYLYSIGIYIYGVLLRLASLFVLKAKQIVIGRRQSLSIIKSKKAEFPNSKWIWIHASSLGEFEQGRHLIDRIALEHENYKIALSFYSPSGYVPRENYKNADMVFYMPLDTRNNAVSLIDELSPDLAIFIKYDFWWNHLSILQSRSIPTVFVSAMIRHDQYFVKNKLGIIRTILSKVNHYYVQTQESADILNSIGISNSTVTGDSRLDSILNEEVKVLPIHDEISNWKGNQKCIIYGSVHMSDMDVVDEMITIDAMHIIVPHDIDNVNIAAIHGKLSNAMVYSQSRFQKGNVVIVDRLGVLRHLYGTADLVYIGGGYGKGIHNTLEPLVQLVPILIGPNYDKFPEAIQLISDSAIKTIDTVDNVFKLATQMLVEPSNDREKTQKQYISSNSGATGKILSSMLKNKWMQEL